ncbi:response regulator [Enterovibrio paralichthyis]|uniref:response regulator n=1 Tax=Enterovibrio paralichthyis TaxID=2853805 RepID=UPI001C477F03|nr:response regulator [Enterovibrio paralichthyis]MBV7299251.1 response regulator [Enterovibrio paralichthyis]
MNKYLILCVDDERDVLDSVVNDLAELEEHFVIEAAESVAEAREILAEANADELQLALILCDHIMPEDLGVDFLIELSQSPATAAARKLLLTGQAGLEETIQAVNHSSLDYYIAKPWQGDALRNVVIDQLSTFVIQQDPNLMPWISVLDAERILKAISDNRLNYSDN